MWRYGGQFQHRRRQQENTGRHNMVRPFRGGGSGTIKARVLAIALIPSIALIVVGAAVSGYLVSQGLQVRQFADDVRGSLEPTSRAVVALQEERRLTMPQLSDQIASSGELDRHRRKADTALVAMSRATDALRGNAPDELRVVLDEFDAGAARLRGTRQQIDAGKVEPLAAYEFYNEMIELAGGGIQGIARSANDAEVGFEQMIAFDLFKSAEAMSRSHSMAVLAVASGLNDDQFHELAHQLGMYHEMAETVVSRMTPDEQRTYAELKESASWQELVSGDNSLMARGPEGSEVKFDVAGWEAAARVIATGLVGLYTAHSEYAADIGTSSGTATLLTSLLTGAVILLAAAAAVVIALRLSRRLIGRLSRLREETLALSERELPDVVERLWQGDRIDVEDQVPWLDHGDDEIGQVANAFNKAQRTAISAAVQEAETRKGVGSVFLNIAHRTQVIVHRQLKVLDKVERSEDDPDQLQLLFQLDHLATRSRRNAENLIILGGEQPGRQWRNPVSLREVVRSAIAETEHYTRVGAATVPDTLMDGSVIADLAHLLAELVDNATAFSPPQARVEVRGNAVGRGVVLEVEDQGLGMDAAQLDKINTMLRKPPDFSVMAMSSESRVGLFVVARLAARHGIKITLRESIYGGTTAIVLIPSVLIAQDSTPHEPPAAQPMLAAGSLPSVAKIDEVTSRQAPEPELSALPVGDPAEPPAIGTGWTTVVFDKPDAEPAASAGQPTWPGGTAARAEPPGVASTPAAPDEKSKPALPRRKRLANLAPQLMDGAADEEQAERDDDLDAERSRSLMAALQHGSIRGRAAEISMNGHR
ncbi:MAG: HAMP domain-containing protein [Actinophytocola sp.]|nr:HAMP domain-containing protein [Actinophytocola sp.]